VTIIIVNVHVTGYFVYVEVTIFFDSLLFATTFMEGHEILYEIVNVHVTGYSTIFYSHVVPIRTLDHVTFFASKP